MYADAKTLAQLNPFGWKTVGKNLTIICDMETQLFFFSMVYISDIFFLD